MTIKIEGPTEAFAAVATVIIAADKLGTMAERDFLFNQVKNLDAFKGYDRAGFMKLLGDTVEKAHQTIPMDGPSFTKQGIEGLIQAVKEVLSPELRMELFGMAVGLVCADEPCDEERNLLEQLQRGLEIDDKAAQDLLGG
jgi:hypothetical protein